MQGSLVFMVRERGGLDTKKGSLHLCKSLKSCTFPSDSSLIGLYLTLSFTFLRTIIRSDNLCC